MANVVGGTVVWNLDVDKGKLTSGLNEARDQVESVAKDVDKSLSGISKSIGDSFKGVGDTLKDMGGSMKDIGKSMSTSITVPIVAASAAALNFVTIGGKYSSVRDSFISMTKDMGISADEFQNRVSKATGGQIDNLKILQSATKGLSLIGKDAFNDFGNDFVKMAELSKKAARATGQDVDFMFDSLVTGIARESKLILDNLGITIDITKAKDEYAKSLGKTREELTISEEKHAVLNSALGQLESTYGEVAVSAGGFGGAWQQLTTLLTNTRIEIGTALEPAIADLTKSLTNTLQVLQPKLIGAVESLVKGFSNLSPQMQTVIVVSTAVVAVLGPLVIILGSVIYNVGVLISSVGGLINVLTILGKKKIIAETIPAISRFSINLAVNAVKSVLLFSFSIIKHAIGALSSLVFMIITKVIPAIAEFVVSMAIKSVLAVTRFVFVLTTQLIPTILRTIIVMSVNLVRAIGNMEIAFVTRGIPAVLRFVSTLITQGIPAVLRFSITVITQTIPAIVSFATTLVVKAINAIVQLAITLVTQTIPAILSMAKALIINAIQAVTKFVAAIVTQMIPSLVNTTVVTTKRFVPAVLSMASSLLINAIRAISSFVAALVTQAIPTMARFVVGILSGILPALISMATTIMTTVIPAIASFIVASAPLILGILTITAVIAGLYLAWKNNFLGIRDFTQQVVGWLRGLLDSVLDIARKIRDSMDKINPFHRESPSLVDNVTKGLEVIRKEFGSLGDFILSPQVTPALASVIQPSELNERGGGFNQDININIERINDEQDIQALGREFGYRASLMP